VDLPFYNLLGKEVDEEEMISMTWKTLIGYKGLYEVSDLGNIRSLLKGIVLKKRGHYKGYDRVCVYKNNVRETILIHRAVAMSFLPNPQELPVVNHKDSDKKNNNLKNLEWATFSENTNHYYNNKDDDNF